MVKRNTTKSLISNTITRRMMIGIAILLVGITAFGVTAFGMEDKTYAAESTLSLSIDNSAVEADVAPTSTNGTFRKGTASTISASTNNATGYIISISAPSASGSDYDKLINASDNTAKISSISSPTTEEQYKALNNTSYNNTWGYLPSKYCSDGTNSTCTTNTDFLPAPTVAGDVLDQTTAANTTANTYTIGMGTRIDSTTKTGKYQGSFIVKLVANAIPYSIIYDDNVVSNMPTDVSSTTPDTSVTIDSKVPARTGYKFLGWCLGTEDASNITTSNGTDTCSSTIYQPNSTLSINQTGTGNNFRLYAMWKELKTFNKAYAAAGKTQSGGYYTMQDANASICSAVDEGQVGEVKDSRDGTIYHIGKLKDGKCWMVENLNLAGGKALSANDTDVTSEYISSFSTSNNLTKEGNTIKLPASSTSGFDSNNYSYVYNSGNKENCGTNDQNTPCYSYYSWDAATLGSGRTISTDNTDAPYSICPKGWRLPTSGADSNNGWKRGDFYALATAYGANLENNYCELYSAAFYNNAGPGTTPNFLLAGNYYSGSFYSVGSDGVYWSSTSLPATDTARFLGFNSRNVYSANSSYRSGGNSVRCVLKTE